MTATVAGRRHDRGTFVPIAAAVLGGGLVGLAAAWTGALDEAGFWFAVLTTAWIIGTAIAFLQPHPSFAFIGLQAWIALNVMNGALLAVLDGYSGLGNYDFTAGIAGGMRIAAVAEVGLVAGFVAVRVVRRDAPRVRLTERIPNRNLDTWSVALVAAGIASMAVYIAASGASFGSINVLAGDGVYGDLKREADGAVIGYLKVLTGLAGVGMMLAAHRLTASRRRPLAPILVLLAGSALLVSSGGRASLLIPAVAAGLLWWKTSASRWTQRPRRMLLLGGLGIFALVALVGGLRGQTGDKIIDPEAFVSKELHGGIFPTTAGLAESVPGQQPYVDGRSFTDAATLAVPRTLWPDKPASALKEVQDGFMPVDIGASFGLQGELYANAGLLGVLLGCVLFAACLEWCWLRLSATPRLSVAIWFAASIPVLILLYARGYVVTFLAAQLGIVLGAAIATRCMNRVSPTTHPDNRRVATTRPATDAT